MTTDAMRAAPKQAGPNSDPYCTTAAVPPAEQAGLPAAPRLARRVVSLGVESAFEVLGRAQQLEASGRSIAHLEAGEPDVATAPHIVEAGIRAMRDGETRYTPSPGTPGLRAAVADAMADRGVHVTPEHVVVTPGSKLMVFHALLALLERGDEALVPDPGYPAYASVAAMSGARPVAYAIDATRPAGLDPAEVASRLTPKTRVLVLNSPHNPTGTTVDRDALTALAELALRHDLMVVSDEIYSRLTFDGERPASIASLPGMAERTVIVDGFSKAYAMTGWRLGFGVMPVPIAQAVTKLVNNSSACTPGFVQTAGIAALRGPQDGVAAMVRALRDKRDRLVAGLNAIPGFTCPVPGGAFYAFPDVSRALRRLKVTANTLADRLLVDVGVACVPGSAFGRRAARHLRFSYATSPETIETALERMHRALDVRRGAVPR